MVDPLKKKLEFTEPPVEPQKEKPPLNRETRSYIARKFFRSYFKKSIYNIIIGGMPSA